MLRPVCVFVALLLLLGNARSEEGAPSFALPMTFDRIWYRAGKNGETGGKKWNGDLTITRDALEFRSPKGADRLPLDSIRAVSLGRISGDVNTDWVVVAAGPPGKTRLVSLRDGAKLGFGRRTAALHRTIRDVLRQAGAGPYDVADGYELYDAMDHQFTVAIPSGWKVRHLTTVEVEGLPMWGRLAFFSGSEEDVEIVLDRREAPAGMRCSGFTRNAELRLEAWVEEDPLFAADGGFVEAPVGDPLPLGDCIARRFRGRVRDAAGADVVLDALAVSDDRTLFFFVLHSSPTTHSQALDRFDGLVSSFQPAVAR